MSFITFLKEKEEAEVQATDEIKQKIKDLFLRNDVIEDDLIHGLADEVGMDAHSLENIVYSMFKEFITKEQQEKEEI